MMASKSIQRVIGLGMTRRTDSYGALSIVPTNPIQNQSAHAAVRFIHHFEALLTSGYCQP